LSKQDNVASLGLLAALVETSKLVVTTYFVTSALRREYYF